MIKPQRALLVGLALNGRNIKHSLKELELLADTAGAETVGSITQNKDSIDRAYYVGSGKVKEIKEFVEENEIDIVIFNNSLSSIQLKNLNDELNVNVIDRSMLILDIFAKRATTTEGKLQIELAQQKYALPRLLGQGLVLSRQGGGIGTRGPGETKLEVDRRTIKRKIFELEQEIKKLKEQRDIRRNKRQSENIKTVAIVGYTNSGKSTLMNLLTKTGTLAEDKLFATLDPITRKIWIDVGKEYLITDTVGFISDLPHEFIDAFKSTLEEAKYADLLLHVVDLSSSEVNKNIEVVKEVLASLGVKNKPSVMVYNKIDLVEKFEKEVNEINELWQNTDAHVCISAKNGTGAEELKSILAEMLFKE
jgi:GTP-binding protein HflX